MKHSNDSYARISNDLSMSMLWIELLRLLVLDLDLTRLHRDGKHYHEFLWQNEGEDWWDPYLE